MRKTRFSDEKIVKILREAEATSVPKAAKKYGVSTASIYAWRKRFHGVDAKEAKRIRELEKENARLKKLLAEKELGLEIMREINSKKW
jgi:putative transposase